MANVADGPPFLQRQFRGVSLGLGWGVGKGWCKEGQQDGMSREVFVWLQ